MREHVWHRPRSCRHREQTNQRNHAQRTVLWRMAGIAQCVHRWSTQTWRVSTEPCKRVTMGVSTVASPQSAYHTKCNSNIVCYTTVYPTVMDYEPKLELHALEPRPVWDYGTEFVQRALCLLVCFNTVRGYGGVHESIPNLTLYSQVWFLGWNALRWWVLGRRAL